MLNPVAGFEKEYSKLSLSAHSKKVLIIGGGPAGLEAAKVAAERGHNVILCEKNESLGGQLRYASESPHKSELCEIITFYERQIEELGIDVRLNCEMKLDAIKKIEPDVIILATGADPYLPAIEGIKSKNVMTATEALLKKDFRGTGSTVIVGGGSLGTEVAEMLLMQGQEVTIIEMKKSIANDMGMSIAINLHERLEKYQFKCVLEAQVTRIDDKAVYFKKRNGEENYIEANKVVLATGYTSNNSLHNHLENLAQEVFIVGDCKSPRKIVNAVHEGFHASRVIE
jgi:pyruvate/2-oxoglutarate dehydrogenase complex dihydrolipoamide dehydrogenase (E3) component